LLVRIAKRENAFLCARTLFVAPSAADGGVELVHPQRLKEALCFHCGRVPLAAVVEGVDALVGRLAVRVHEQPELVGGAEPIAKRNHLAKLPGRVDVQKGKWNSCRCKCLLRETRENRRVLPYAVEHDRLFELGSDLAKDVNALGLEMPKVREGADCGRHFIIDICLL
jgi:hypothetical protein